MKGPLKGSFQGLRLPLEGCQWLVPGLGTLLPLWSLPNQTVGVGAGWGSGLWHSCRPFLHLPLLIGPPFQNRKGWGKSAGIPFLLSARKVHGGLGRGVPMGHHGGPGRGVRVA